MSEVLVYCPHSAPRLQYIVHWILTQRFGLDVQITHNLQEADTYAGAKINYSNQYLHGYLNINAGSVLLDTAINEDFGAIGAWHHLKTIFHSGEGDIPFDIFGAAFYAISRMEEYGENTVDQHGRYAHSNSVFYKLGVLEMPIVDQWIEKFRESLTTMFPMLSTTYTRYTCMPTMDVDQAFCYLGKGIYRNLGGLLRDLCRFRFSEIWDRLLVLGGFKPDPFDTFDDFIKLHQGKGTSARVFWLLADPGPYDKNTNYRAEDFKQRVLRTLEVAVSGIHPSYDTPERFPKLKQELERFQEILGEPATHSRQHYLRLQIPGSCLTLHERGIRHEYSMGYATVPGFRAGTCHPFHWFNLLTNEVTTLTIYPISVMDVTLKNYLGLNPDQALQKASALVQEVKQVHGFFVPLWHNESLSNRGEWKGWKSMYFNLIQEASN